MKTSKIKLSEEEQVFCDYRFIHTDLSEGLNYGVDRSMYERAMRFFGATPRDGEINARIYVDDVWKAKENRVKP